jgi:hypothetical protein
MTANRHYSVEEGKAHVTAHLPPDWTVRFVGFTRSWVAYSPAFAADGVSVQGPTPEATVTRVRALLAHWTPEGQGRNGVAHPQGG